MQKNKNKVETISLKQKKLLVKLVFYGVDKSKRLNNRQDCNSLRQKSHPDLMKKLKKMSQILKKKLLIVLNYL